MSETVRPEAFRGVVQASCTREELLSERSSVAAGPIGSTVRFPALGGQITDATANSVRAVDMWVSPAGLVTQGARPDGQAASVVFWPRAVMAGALARLLALPADAVAADAGAPDLPASFAVVSPRDLMATLHAGGYGPHAQLHVIWWRTSPDRIVARLHLPSRGTWWGAWTGPGQVAFHNGRFEALLPAALGPALEAT